MSGELEPGLSLGRAELPNEAEAEPPGGGGTRLTRPGVGAYGGLLKHHRWGPTISSAMALRRGFSPLRLCTSRLAPLSTAPAAREQPTPGPGVGLDGGAKKVVRPPLPIVNFDNTQEAYRSRRSWELARNLLVLRLCASPALLARHEQVCGKGGCGGRATSRCAEAGAGWGLRTRPHGGEGRGSAWPGNS